MNESLNYNVLSDKKVYLKMFSEIQSVNRYGCKSFKKIYACTCTLHLPHLHKTITDKEASNECNF